MNRKLRMILWELLYSFIFVLLWYSSSIIFLLGMQMRTSNEIFENSSKHSSELFVRSLRVQSNNKEILKELVDKQKRDKLWNIYLDKSGDMHHKITRAETLRIRNIEKRLAILNEEDSLNNEEIPDENSLIRSNSDLCSSVTDLSASSRRLRTRRRSSLDQKILEDWKVLADELKSS